MEESASVLIVNLEDDTEAFVDFCRRGAADLLAADPPIYAFTIRPTSTDPSSRSSEASLLFGNWPRSFASAGAMADTASDLVRREIAHNRLVTLVALAKTPEQLEASAVVHRTIADVSSEERSRVVVMGALTCGPSADGAVLSRLLSGEKRMLDVLFLLGGRGQEQYALNARDHYSGLRFVTDLARDIGSARDRIRRKPQQTNPLYWIAPLSLAAPKNATTLRGFLRDSLTDYLRPLEPEKLLAAFEAELENRKLGIRAIRESSAGVAQDNIELSRSSSALPLTRGRAIDFLRAYENEVMSNAGHLLLTRLPETIGRTVHTVDLAFRSHHAELLARPPHVPRTDRTTGLQARIRKVIDGLKGEELDLARQAREERAPMTFSTGASPEEIDGPGGSADRFDRETQHPAPPTQQTQPAPADVARIVAQLPEAGRFRTLIRDARDKVSEFPQHTLSYFVGLLALLAVVAGMALHYGFVVGFGARSREIWAAPLAELRFVAIAVALILLPLAAGRAVFCVNSRRASQVMNRLAAGLAELSEPVNRVARSAAEYLHTTRASLYASELVRHVDRPNGAGQFDRLIAELGSLEGKPETDSPHVREQRDMLKARLDTVTIGAELGMRAIEYWREKSAGAHKWTMKIEQSHDRDIASDTGATQASVDLANSYVAADVEIAVIPLQLPLPTAARRNTPARPRGRRP